MGGDVETDLGSKIKVGQTGIRFLIPKVKTSPAARYPKLEKFNSKI